MTSDLTEIADRWTGAEGSLSLLRALPPEIITYVRDAADESENRHRLIQAHPDAWTSHAERARHLTALASILDVIMEVP